MSLHLEPIHTGPAIGPVDAPALKKKARELYSHPMNETASLTDRIFKDTTLACQTVQQDYEFEPTGTESAATIIKNYDEMICEHIERRILFAFQQLIVCYQTKLHFESKGAESQGENNNGGTFQRRAAHSSTLPCLIAYDNTEWIAYKKGENAKPQGFIFLKGTDYYRDANATMTMAKWINDADEIIDNKTLESLLRHKMLALINAAAQGDVTPEAAILQFVQHALDEVGAGQKRVLKKEGKHSPTLLVLKRYNEYLSEFQIYVKNNSFLESFLNIKLGIGESETRLILQMRYKAIRDTQVAQSALLQKIKGVQLRVLEEVKEGKKKKPAHFDAAFRAVLIHGARTVADRHRLEKLYNFSLADFEARMEDNAPYKRIKAKLLNPPYRAKITFIAQVVLKDMRSLRTQELQMRALMIKQFRWTKGWTQKELGEKVKARFAFAAASQSTICRIERGEKLVNVAIAKEFSEVFQIDSGLFMPQFFYA